MCGVVLVPGTRWIAAIGTVARPIDATGRRLARTAGGGVIFTIADAIVALLVAARSAPASVEARPAAAVGRGEQPERFESGVAELDEVSVALSTAGRQRAESEAGC